MSTTYAATAPSDIPPPGGEAVIALRGVTKRFGSHTVLKDLTFDVPRGKISAVLGPSGTGKSVLLKNIIGLLRPEEGQIYVDGEPIVGIRHKDILRIRRKFGVLFQDGALFGSMDIFDNIAFPLREHTTRSEREIKALVMEKAEMVGMVAHLKKLPGEISGGMRKRAGLARALILDPEIVFFDEPDSGLDPVRVAYLDELVKSVQKETGCTFFIITHNIDSVKRTADYIGMLYRSSLVRFGPAKDMFVSDRALVKQFLAGSSVGPIGMDEMVDAARGEADVAALLAEDASARPGAGASGSDPTTDVLPAAGEHVDGHLDDGWVPPASDRVDAADQRTERLPSVDADSETRAVPAIKAAKRWNSEEAEHDDDAAAGRRRRLGGRRPSRLLSAGTAPAKPKTRSPKPPDPAAVDLTAAATEDGELLEDLDPAERKQIEEEEALFRQRNG